jgi:predicted dehydrogenase
LKDFGTKQANHFLKTNLATAVIGLGVGESHILAYQDHPMCELKAICDFEPSVLKKMGLKYSNIKHTADPEHILKDPDIDLVSIASYDNFHAEQIVRALSFGKHVFVEKPLCQNRTELDKIVKHLNARSDLNLSSNLILRRTPRFEELKKRVNAGELGQTYHFEGSYDYGRLEKLTKGWRGEIPNYSVTHGGGIHIIDLMLWLSGKKIDEVQGTGNRIPTETSSFKGFSLTSAILRFDDGSTAQISSNFASVAPHHHKLSVYGTLGTFEQGHLGAGYFFSRDPRDRPSIVDSPYPGTQKGDLIYNFIDSILGDTEPLITKQEVIEAMTVSIAIDESIKTGKAQKVNYPILR